jgi:hypothetical protein
MFSSLTQFLRSAREPPPRITAATSSVRGATGLSRASLAHMVLRDGPFGRDSDLDPATQHALLALLDPAARMPRWNGTRSQHVPVLDSPQRAALLGFAALAVAGQGSVDQATWTQAGAAGLSREQRREVLAVIGLVQASVGLPPRRRDDEARMAVVSHTPAVSPAERPLPRAA